MFDTAFYKILRKEGNVLFNDALNTFYLRLYGVRYMVKNHSNNEKGYPLPPHRLLLSINSNHKILNAMGDIYKRNCSNKVLFYVCNTFL